MMTQKEYEEAELRRAMGRIQEVERAPLQDRQEARDSWGQAMLDPYLVAERVRWMLDGSYGYGEMLLAHRAVNSQGNVAAQLGVLIACFEWECPSNMAIQAWKGLTPSQQMAVNSAILREVEKWKGEQAQGE